MTFEVWMTFVLASSALMLIPGPTMLFMIGVALSDGLKQALSALPGLAVGLFASITISLSGAGVLLLASAQLFIALKLVGAGYLIFLGVRLWMSKPQVHLVEAGNSQSQTKLFWPAFLVTVLNPKALNFYITFLPQFIDANAAIAQQFIVLGATFFVVALIAAILSAFAGSSLRYGVKNASAVQLLNQCGASAMVASGVLTASSVRN